jgi:hypothetical protein
MFVKFITERIDNMTAKKPFSIATILLSILLIVSLLNVQVAFADGETPTEPPAPTQVETEPPPPTESAVEPAPPTEAPIESTPEPVEAAPVPAETTVVPIEEVLTQVPDNTEVVVLNEDGEPLPLATQEAADIVAAIDPIWCPVGVLPGGPGCSDNFTGDTAITQLLNDMVTNTSNYAKDGVIYFTPFAVQSFLLTQSNLGTLKYNALNNALQNYSLTLQGGWNGNLVSPVVAGQTVFHNDSVDTYVSIGTPSNRWLGKITLNDIIFSGVATTNALTIYTDSGDITLGNVDVMNQSGGRNTALLNTNSGNITVQNGSMFDGDGTNSNGFGAATGSGSITISDTSFTDVTRPNTQVYDAARLTAGTVTLTNVTAERNDGHGIRIENANLVTLNHVLANYNGTGTNYSGVYVNGNPGSRLIIAGGTFNDNKGYGVQIGNTANTTVYIQSMPVCENNARNPLSCFNSGVTVISDNTAPVISSMISGTAGANGWYGGDVSVSWSVVDAESGILSESGCSVTNLNTETTGTTLTCSATNKAGLSSSESVTIKIDKTAPALTLPANITSEATGPAGAVVGYAAAANDLVDGAIPVSCSPLSGTTFPLGTTTVNCSAADQTDHVSSATFLITVEDTTAPSIAPLADIILDTYHKTGKNVNFTSPSTFDIVDGVGIASCSPAPGSFFEMGTTEVTCTATDSHGNTATRTFFIYVDRVRQTSALQSSGSSPLIVPLPGAEKIDLDCDSVFWAFGVKLSFVELCDFQTIVKSISINKLPGKLPDGFAFVMGLDVSLFKGNETIQDVPSGASVQLDFPAAGGAEDQFALLFWNGSEWIKLSPQDDNDQNSQMLSIVTDEVGAFVLVKK